MSVSYNKLDSLPKSISKLSKLKFLELYGNRLPFFQDEIASLSNLRGLSIQLKPIDERGLKIPANFNQLNKLAYLSLKAEKLDWDDALIKIGAIKSLENVILNFHNSVLSSKIGDLKYVKYLSLDKSTFNTFPEATDVIPKELGLLPNLQHLELLWSPLKIFPEEMKGLKSLTYLFLNLRENKTFEFNNNFSRIAKIPNLKVFAIQSGELGALYSDTAISSSIEALILSNNEITSFHPNFIRLSKLKKLDLSRNKLAYLPTGLNDLEELKILKANYNPILDLPISLIYTKNLVELHVKNTKIPTDAIQYFKLNKTPHPITIYSN